MRFIIVVDERSHVCPTTLWHKFDERRRKRWDEGVIFEILPIPHDILDIARYNSTEQLRERARHELARVIDRYAETKCCVIVYAEPQGPPSRYGEPHYFDRALIQFRGQKELREIVLNERLGPTKRSTWLISSPSTQPLLTEIVVEYALVEILGEP